MISCDQHDYIEIACMYKYPIELFLSNGSTIRGIGIDTTYNKQRQHCIKLQCAVDEKEIVLDDIKKMKACINNPHFDCIDFI